jgi:hypothetical protein
MAGAESRDRKYNDDTPANGADHSCPAFFLLIEAAPDRFDIVCGGNVGFIHVRKREQAIFWVHFNTPFK